MEGYLWASCKLTHGKGIIKKKLIGGESDTSTASHEPIKNKANLSRINLSKGKNGKKPRYLVPNMCFLNLRTNEKKFCFLA